MKLRTLDLFAGIGGISLGLERTGGFETVGFCEIDKAAQKVLKKHWPNVPIFEDVKTLSAKDFNGSIDVITGGFPCQDISLAGKGAGLAGERSGLWFEYLRLIQEAQPKWVIAENVAALRSRGLDQVLRSLSEIGYDAEWHCIPASAVGAPHRRDRIWIVAYPNSNDGRHQGSAESCKRDPRVEPWGGGNGQHEQESGSLLADSESQRWTVHDGSFSTEFQTPSRPVLLRGVGDEYRPETWNGGESGLDRVVDGVSAKMDGSIRHRLKQLGNAVVPQIPELIGRAILQAS
jgi:DNA (cytosine-5)-methyltransferase 1